MHLLILRFLNFFNLPPMLSIYIWIQQTILAGDNPMTTPPCTEELHEQVLQELKRAQPVVVVDANTKCLMEDVEYFEIMYKFNANFSETVTLLAKSKIEETKKKAYDERLVLLKEEFLEEFDNLLEKNEGIDALYAKIIKDLCDLYQNIRSHDEKPSTNEADKDMGPFS